MPRLIHLPTFTDNRGKLTTYDPGNQDLPFEPKRVFWIYDVNGERANHSHEVCEQIIIPIAGDFTIEIDDNKYLLTRHTGLYIETGYKIRLYNFSEDALCLVLCSEYYDERDIKT